VSALRQWDATVGAMTRAGTLILRKLRNDTVLEGRTHERFDEYAGGVRVFGGDIARQNRGGVTESIFGHLYDVGGVDTRPGLDEDGARSVFARLSAAGEFPPDRPIELVILPTDDGRFVLTYRAHVWTVAGWMHTFIDASSGEVVLQYDDRQTQAAVGSGTGVLGDRKKVSARAFGGGFIADDQLRPPVLTTYDANGNPRTADSWLFRSVQPGLPNVASDSDNTWTDGDSVDAHVYVGWTYDYLFTRLARRSLDDGDVAIRAIVHPVRRSDLESASESDLDYFLNAFWCGGCGADHRGFMVFGEGLPTGYSLTSTGQYVDYFSAGLDVVAHELTHGITDYSSQLIYRNESGALNESFSDMIGTSVEFFFQQPGAGLERADYLIGEDVFRPGGLRSMANPGSFGDPDHYSRLKRTTDDNGGVHTNSGISNQAFYLAIEGGVNRTSGLRVEGVGAANREQIEKVFYRAFVFLLPSSARFSTARAATIQSARDLYGAGSPAERAVTQAWTAVGVF
jgi:Zn-dependent metalloprotease